MTSMYSSTHSQHITDASRTGLTLPEYMDAESDTEGYTSDGTRYRRHRRPYPTAQKKSYLERSYNKPIAAEIREDSRADKNPYRRRRINASRSEWSEKLAEDIESKRLGLEINERTRDYEPRPVFQDPPSMQLSQDQPQHYDRTFETIEVVDYYTPVRQRTEPVQFSEPRRRARSPSPVCSEDVGGQEFADTIILDRDAGKHSFLTSKWIAI